MCLTHQILMLTAFMAKCHVIQMPYLNKHCYTDVHSISLYQLFGPRSWGYQGSQKHPVPSHVLSMRIQTHPKPNRRCHFSSHLDILETPLQRDIQSTSAGSSQCRGTMDPLQFLLDVPTPHSLSKAHPNCPLMEAMSQSIKQ